MEEGEKQIKQNRIQGLKELLNKYIRQGFPQRCLVGRLILIKKENNYHLRLNQCRSIQINSMLIKITEKIILKRIEADMHNHNRLLNIR